MTTLVLLAMLLAEPSKRPAPTPAKETQKEQNQAGREQTVSKANNEPAKAPSTSVQQTSPEVTVRYEQYPGQQSEALPPRDWWAVANTSAITLFTLALAVLAFRQWRAMDRQAKLMHRQAVLMGKQLAEMQSSGTLMLRQLEASDRPWVTASFEADTPLRFDTTGCLHVGFKMWLKNLGHSIATHISVEHKIVPDGVLRTDHRAAVAAQDEIAQRLKPSDIGPVLFAGEDMPIFVPLKVDSIERYAIDADGERYVLLCLAVVIKYRYPTSDRDHTTRIAFAFGNEHGYFENLLGIKLGETLRPDNITILRLTSGGGAD